MEQDAHGAFQPLALRTETLQELGNCLESELWGLGSFVNFCTLTKKNVNVIASGWACL